jgi:type IV secretory pathway VirD2 relaxase
MLTDEEKPFRLRPRKPLRTRSENQIGSWSVLYKAVMRHARMSHNRRGLSGGHVGKASQRHFQRCAIRATYTRNAVKGQWKAHGRYLARESAQLKGKTAGTGFDAEGSVPDPAARMDAWQRAGDEQMWKLIISPEFGDRIDLQKLARELIQRIEDNRRGAALEWIAVDHYNTEHPHVHVALRGVDRDGNGVRFPREFIKTGIRELAENLCTQQLGYRTGFDAAAAQRREVDQLRFTSLDRTISRSGSAGGGGQSGFMRITVAQPQPLGVKDGPQLRNQHVIERLMALQRMGLAEPEGPNEWRVRRDFESVLRGIQLVADRQRVLAAHGTPLSDERLPIEATEGRDWKLLEGRVLVHGEEEGGRRYLMLEGTDARVHHVYYTPEIEEARSRSKLQTNAFVRLRRYVAGGALAIQAEDLGDAESMVRNKSYLHAAARQSLQRGILPQESGWGGWLGRFQAALHLAAVEIEKAGTHEISRGRKSGNSRGR